MKIWIFFVLAIALILQFFLTVALEIGEVCIIRKDETGICKIVYECDHVVEKIKIAHTTEQILELRKLQCGRANGKVLVCCVNQVENLKKMDNLLPNRSSCGRHTSRKIWGGTETQLTEFPWMALLEYKDKYGGKRHLCGGTLINRRYILTAAHCLVGNILSIGQLINVRLGAHSRTRKSDCDETGCNSPITVSVEKKFVHPAYIISAKYHDIGLVRLSKEVNYTRFILPLCLPLVGEKANVGDEVVVAGWGAYEEGSSSDVKRSAALNIPDQSECDKYSLNGVYINKTTQLCVEGITGTDSCKGDSGGPLMKLASNDSSLWYQEGIVSFGVICVGKTFLPGVYTRVEPYLSWIYENILP